MAYAMMGGLAVATVLTLIFLPALYVIWFRIKAPHPDVVLDPVVEQSAIPGISPEAAGSSLPSEAG
jgi:hypothetical protein